MINQAVWRSVLTMFANLCQLMKQRTYRKLTKSCLPRQKVLFVRKCIRYSQCERSTWAPLGSFPLWNSERGQNVIRRRLMYLTHFHNRRTINWNFLSDQVLSVVLFRCGGEADGQGLVAAHCKPCLGCVRMVVEMMVMMIMTATTTTTTMMMIKIMTTTTTTMMMMMMKILTMMMILVVVVVMMMMMTTATTTTTTTMMIKMQRRRQRWWW